MNRGFRNLFLLLLPAILFGCGQKGPLTLPTPQFPAPADQPATPPKNSKQ